MSPLLIAKRWCSRMVREHRAFIEATKKHDVAEAVRMIEEHVRGAGRHLMEPDARRAILKDSPS